MKIKVLVVEDDLSIIKLVKEQLKSDLPDLDVEDCNFSAAEKKISEISPDIVILDLLLGNPAERKVAGDKTFDFVWGNKFCPVVVYSAHPELLDSEHPFVEKVQKGMGSPEILVKVIKTFIPHVSLLSEAEAKVRVSFALAMKNVAPAAFNASKVPAEQLELIDRGGRRYLAALMDEKVHVGTLFCWEQYICPPISKDVLLGDIIVEAGKPLDSPTSFRIVLTPSCDMATPPAGGKPKVEKVLVAHCCVPKEAIAKVPSAANKDNLVGYLNQGYVQSFLPLAAYLNRIPLMMADLRKLDLISIDNISIDDSKQYVRVASLDSPFRELVAWAYLQIACRPGLPDRDCVSLAKEILQA